MPDGERSVFVLPKAHLHAHLILRASPETVARMLAGIDALLGTEPDPFTDP